MLVILNVNVEINVLGRDDQQQCVDRVYCVCRNSCATTKGCVEVFAAVQSHF